MHRRTFIVGSSAFIALAHGASAAERIAFSPAAFEAAQKTGRPLLVHVTAPWCTDCRAQKPIVSQLLDLPDFGPVVFVDIDYDSQKETLRKLNIQKQATLVAYKGDKEIARIVGDTRRPSIEALMRKAL
jgi:thioredoxin 1